MSIIGRPGHGDTTDVSLTNVELVQASNGNYYLDITYHIETDQLVNEVHMPRVSLPLSPKGFEIHEYGTGWPPLYKADVGFGTTHMHKDKDGVCYTVKTIEIKTKEMTLEEIEKRLGHKVKIVNRED